MNRSLVLKIHLVLSSVFIPFLLIIPLSGSLYLLGIKGDSTKTQVMIFDTVVPTDLKEKEAFFRNFFTENKIDFKFESIKETPSELIFRPTTNDYYTVAAKDGQWTLFQIRPSLLSKMMELHKGHGPQIMKKFEAAFGIGLILVLLSGLWLAMTVPKYRKISLVSAAVGILIMVGLIL